MLNHMLIQSWNLKLGRPKEISKELMTHKFMIGVVWRRMALLLLLLLLLVLLFLLVVWGCKNHHQGAGHSGISSTFIEEEMQMPTEIHATWWGKSYIIVG